MGQLVLVDQLLRKAYQDEIEIDAEKIIEEFYKDNIPLPQRTLSDIVDTVFNSKYYSFFMNSMKLLQVEQLYYSRVHGQEHIERVCLLVAYLAVRRNVNAHIFILCLECAKYHDIGRCSDSEDRLHGKRGSEKIPIVCPKMQKRDLELVKAVVEAHSVSDNDMETIFRQYNILVSSDFEIYKTILYILKDADALDRFRLSAQSLKINFLRLPESVELIRAAYELYKVSSYYSSYNVGER